MTKKSSITKDLGEILEYLGIDRTTARELVQNGIKRLLEPQIDNRINAFLHSDPENKKEIST